MHEFTVQCCLVSANHSACENSCVVFSNSGGRIGDFTFIVSQHCVGCLKFERCGHSAGREGQMKITMELCNESEGLSRASIRLKEVKLSISRPLATPFSFLYCIFYWICFLTSPPNAVTMSLTCKTIWDVKNLFVPWSQKDANHPFLIANFSYPVD